MPEQLKLRRLSQKESGGCPVCEAPAYPYAIEGFEGYIDACPEHAQSSAIDSVANGWIERASISDPARSWDGIWFQIRSDGIPASNANLQVTIAGKHFNMGRSGASELAHALLAMVDATADLER